MSSASPSPSPSALGKGILGDALFGDVFKRADKNDDARIDYAEFVEFFGDSFASNAELAQFFAAADTDASKNIDHKELSSFFAAGVAGRTYTPIFATLERLHAELNAALVASHANNQLSSGNATELFKERFFLREIASQLETLQHTADIGLAGVSALTPVAADAVERDRFELSSLPQRAAPPADTSAASAALQAQVDKLGSLIARLEKGKARFNVPDEEIGLAHDTEACFVIARTFAGVDAAAHIGAVKALVAAARRQPACRHVSVRVVRSGAAADVFIHEIWEENDEFAAWEAGAEFVALSGAVASKSAKSSSERMHLPASWFVYQ
jgi:hypothetical protein